MWQPLLSETSFQRKTNNRSIKPWIHTDLEHLVMEEDGIMEEKLIVKLNLKRLKIIENYQWDKWRWGCKDSDTTELNGTEPKHKKVVAAAGEEVEMLQRGGAEKHLQGETDESRRWNGYKRGRERLKKNAGRINSERLCSRDAHAHLLDTCCVAGAQPHASPPCATTSPREQNLQAGP